ncbi:hypothetical protein [Pseudomonas sp. Hp2]|uniref:hypothetical protein n=1 Tax=Pseudomonas sp. Hp2 TaxID=701189 RepID=UPI001C498141|nr:hypothetical protein [Pseudomonas sp. Hp2]
MSVLGCLFFLSGAAALLYQVCWQRVLFAGLGSDALSIAVVVCVFMLGLGVGGLLGGWLADHVAYPLRWFVTIELSIAGYGLCSTGLIDQMMMKAGGLGYGATFIGALLVLMVPTTLMGMTLPVLVILLDRVVRSIGEATGMLYLANTMGAAVGAVVTSMYLFHMMDLRQVTWLAAGFNSVVAIGGWVLARRENA